MALLHYGLEIIIIQHELITRDPLLTDNTKVCSRETVLLGESHSSSFGEKLSSVTECEYTRLSVWRMRTIILEGNPNSSHNIFK